MIFTVDGDLLKSDCFCIGHQSNCKMGFGSGIAGQIRQQFPYAYDAFISDNRLPKQKLGKYSIGISQDKTNPIIFNLYGQLDYGISNNCYTIYNSLKDAIIEMVLWVKNLEQSFGKEFKIGLPYLIGAGLAGGNWTLIYKIIEDISNEFCHDIYLYRFTP